MLENGLAVVLEGAVMEYVLMVIRAAVDGEFHGPRVAKFTGGLGVDSLKFRGSQASSEKGEGETHQHVSKFPWYQ
jgi:hypothetical protein